jgi:hypothetical protein
MWRRKRKASYKAHGHVFFVQDAPGYMCNLPDRVTHIVHWWILGDFEGRHYEVKAWMMVHARETIPKWLYIYIYIYTVYIHCIYIYCNIYIFNFCPEGWPWLFAGVVWRSTDLHEPLGSKLQSSACQQGGGQHRCGRICYVITWIILHCAIRK